MVNVSIFGIMKGGGRKVMMTEEEIKKEMNELCTALQTGATMLTAYDHNDTRLLFDAKKRVRVLGEEAIRQRSTAEEVEDMSYQLSDARARLAYYRAKEARRLEDRPNLLQRIFRWVK
jgi:hypothetical protein